MEKVFFKIVIPNYNNIAYLPQCLDSILNQTFQDFRIILVDDQSTDFSYELAKSYERKFPEKIIVIQTETKRYAGGCRNIGIDYPLACEYYYFIDSDDYLYSDNSLKLLFDNLADKPDVLLYKYADFVNDKIYLPQKYFSPDEVIRSNNALGYRYNSMWSKAIRSDKIIKCLENCMHGEDTYVWASLILNGSRLKFLDEFITVYRHNKAGVTKQHDGLYQKTESVYKNKLIEIYFSTSNAYIKNSIAKLVFAKQFLSDGLASRIPKIYSIEQTLNALISTNKSFIRFGDGEFQLMHQVNNVFEKQNKELSLSLIKILQSYDKNIMVGIPRCYFFIDPDMVQQVGSWLNNYRTIFKNEQSLNLLSRDKEYYDSYATIQYKEYRDDRVDFRKYFEKIKTIFKNKNILVATGDKRLKDFSDGIFEYADNVEWFVLNCPKNSYAKKQEIYNYIAEHGKNKLIIMAFGPTGKVVGYELIKNMNMRIIDCGHLFKTYYLYTKGINKINVNNFWSD